MPRRLSATDASLKEVPELAASGATESRVITTEDEEIHTVIDAVVAAEQVLSDSPEEDRARNETEDSVVISVNATFTSPPTELPQDDTSLLETEDDQATDIPVTTEVVLEQSDLDNAEQLVTGVSEGVATSQQASSFEALCQAAKSELQNISKSNDGVVKTSHGQLTRATIGQVGGASPATTGKVYQVVTNSSPGGGFIELKPATVLKTDTSGTVVGEKKFISVLDPATPLPSNSSAGGKVIYTHLVGSVAKKIQIPAQNVVVNTGATQQINQGQSHFTVAQIQPQSLGGRRRKHPAKPGRHICPYCGRGCAKPSVLQKHVRAHTGERPYPCNACNISFKTKSNLYKHCKSRAHRAKVMMTGSTESSLGDTEMSFEDMTDESETSGSMDHTGSSLFISSPSTSQIPQSAPVRLLTKPQFPSQAIQSQKPIQSTQNRVLVTPLNQGSGTLQNTNRGLVKSDSVTVQSVKAGVNVAQSEQGSEAAQENMILVMNPDGTLALKPLSQNTPLIKTKPDAVSTLQVPQMGPTVMKTVSAAGSTAESKPVAVSSKLETLPDKSMKVTIHLVKPGDTSEVGSGESAGLLGAKSHLSPVVGLMGATQSAPRSLLTSTPIASNFISTPTLSLELPSNSDSNAEDVTSKISERISNLISQNQAIVNTPMADAPRIKRVIRQRSEMFGLSPNQNEAANILTVQRLNRAHSMDVSLLNKHQMNRSKSVTEQTQQDSSPFLHPKSAETRKIGFLENSSSSCDVIDDRKDERLVKDVSFSEDAELVGELQDESGDAVQVLQQLQSADDTFTSEESAASGDRSAHSGATVKELLLRKSLNQPQQHPFIHTGEGADPIGQQTLYNYKCQECNEEMQFTDIKSIREHARLHKRALSPHQVPELQSPRNLTHSQSVIDVNRRTQHNPLTSSKSLDSADKVTKSGSSTPRLGSVPAHWSSESLEKKTGIKTSHPPVIFEMVDPTRPPKRGRPKGARNLPKDQSSTESEAEFYFGSTRWKAEGSSSSGSGTMPTLFVARSGSQMESSPSLDMERSIDLGMTPDSGNPAGDKVFKTPSLDRTGSTSKDSAATFSVPHSLPVLSRHPQLQSASSREESPVKMKLKDKILNRQAGDKKRSPLDARQTSAPIGQGASTNQKEGSSLPVKGIRRWKEIVRQTRSLDDPPPRKRPRLMRQQSVMEPLSIAEENHLLNQRRNLENLGRLSVRQSSAFVNVPSSAGGGDAVMNEEQNVEAEVDANLKEVANEKAESEQPGTLSMDMSRSPHPEEDADEEDSDESLATNAASADERKANKENIHVEDYGKTNKDGGTEMYFHGVHEQSTSNYKTGHSKSVLRQLYGVRSAFESDVNMTSELVTNRSEMTFHDTPPRPAPSGRSTRLQSDHLPLSVARRVPGMVKLTQSMEIDDIDEAAGSVAGKTDKGAVSADDVTSESDMNENSTKGKTVANSEEKHGDEENQRNESVQVVTNQSTYTIDISGKKDQSMHEKESQEEKRKRSKSESERMTQIPEELKGKDEVLLALVGHAYPVLRTNTHTTLCSVHKPQPMYVPQREHPTLSMYSTWQAAPYDPNPAGLTTRQLLRLYLTGRGEQGSARVGQYLSSPSGKREDGMEMTHSSYWARKNEEIAQSGLEDGDKLKNGGDVIFATKEAKTKFTVEVISVNSPPEAERQESGETNTLTLPARSESHPIQRAQTDPTSYLSVGGESFDLDMRRRTESTQGSRMSLRDLGFKSEEEYTYVRGRGRGKYVCKECGIRCKKPSMLKKHLRTHTDLRPFVCKYCSFAFKTKGNLTKHMKSKTHHKKCVELGILPVPVMVDDTCIAAGEYSVQVTYPESLPVPQRVITDGQVSQLGPVAYIDHAGSYVSADDISQADDLEDDDDDDEDQELEEEQVDMDNMVVVDAPPTATSERGSSSGDMESKYIHVQNQESGQPMLVKLSTDRHGHTVSELMSLQAGQGGLREGLLRDSTDTEVAASLLDLSKTAKQQQQQQARSDSDSPDALRASDRLDSLIGKLIYRTGPEGEREIVTHSDPAFAVIDHPLLYAKSKSPTPLTSPAVNQSESSLPSHPAKTASSGSGFIPPAFDGSRDKSEAESVETPPTVVLKVQPGTDNISKKDLDDMIGNILKQVKVEAKQKILLEIQYPETHAPSTQTAMLSAQTKDDDVGACVNPQEIQADRYASPAAGTNRPPLIHTSDRAKPRLTDLQIRQMDPSLDEHDAPAPASSNTKPYPRPPPNIRPQPRVRPINLDSNPRIRPNVPPVIITPPSPMSPRRLSRILKRQASFNEPDRQASVSEAETSASPMTPEKVRRLTKLQIMTSQTASPQHVASAPVQGQMIFQGHGRSQSLNQGQRVQGQRLVQGQRSPQGRRSPQQTSVSVSHTIHQAAVSPQGRRSPQGQHIQIQAQRSPRGQLSPSLSAPIQGRISPQQGQSSPQRARSPQGRRSPKGQTSSDAPLLLSKSLERKMPPIQIEPIPGRTVKIVRRADGKYECHMCNKLFPEAALLKAHLKVHQFDLPFRCDTCSVSFRSVEQLEKHVKSDAHTAYLDMKQRLGDNPRPYRCHDCDVAFRIHGHLAKHLRSRSHIMSLENTGKLPIGTLSELESKGLNMLSVIDAQSCLEDILHMIRDGAIDVDTSHFSWPALPGRQSNPQPKTSETVLLSSVSLQEPMTRPAQPPAPVRSVSVSSTPHKCGICGGQSFENMAALKEHLLSHAEIRPYVCEFCDAGFTTAASLETHLATHTPQPAVSKDIECEECNLRFDDVPLLIQHFQSHHTSSTSAKFEPSAMTSQQISPQIKPDLSPLKIKPDLSPRGSPKLTRFTQELIKTESETGSSSVASSQGHVLLESTNQMAENQVTLMTSSADGSASALSTLQTPEVAQEQRVEIVQGVQDGSEGGRMQVIQLSSDAFELTEQIQRGPDGVERPVKVMVINWDKVHGGKP